MAERIRAESLSSAAPLSGLAGRFESDLFDDWLPFMERHVIDAERGGFPCEVWPDGSRHSDARNTWYEGRGLWVYSHLYTTLAPEQRYLDVARRCLELLDRSRPPGGLAGRPRLLNPDGSPAGQADPEVYSDLFVAEGLAAHSRACGDDDLWELAFATVCECRARFDSPGYEPALSYVSTRDGHELASQSRGARPLGVWMLLIRVMTELLSHRADARVQDQLSSAVQCALDQHLRPRFALLGEVTEHDGAGPMPGTEGFVYLGHAIETLWMIMEASLLTGEQEVFDQATELFRRHCDVARDPIFGGLFRALVDVDEATFTLDKTLWVQEEAMVGCLLLLSNGESPWAADLFRELDDYVHTSFSPDGWHRWAEECDRSGSTAVRRPRTENYHHPRLLMRAVTTLR